MQKLYKKQIIKKGAANLTRWIGSTASLIIHTLIFLISFLLPTFHMISFDRMLLVLTTVVSLEAIYLSIFIQLSLNEHAESIEIIQEDIQEIGEDIDEIGDEIEELGEDIDELGEDIDDLEEDIESIQKEFEVNQEGGIESSKTDRELLLSIQKSIIDLKKEIEVLQSRSI